MELIADLLRYVNRVDLEISSETNGSLLTGNQAGYLFLSSMLGSKATSLDNEQLALNVFLKSRVVEDFSFCFGEAGVLWLLNLVLLKSNGQHDKIQNIATKIQCSLQVDIGKKDYDLFYGYIGKAKALIDNRKLNSEEIIVYVRDILSLRTVDENKSLVWLDAYYSERSLVKNLGFCHGIPSVLYFLSDLIYKIPALPDRAFLSGIIEQAINILLSYRGEYGMAGFPKTSFDTGESRLGWCYGDLGIAYGILVASKFTNKPKFYKKIALEIALHTCKRTIQESQVCRIDESYYDLGICHGLSGIVLLYDKIWSHTRENKLFEQREFYHTQLLVNIQQFLKSDSTIENIRNGLGDISLLNGISGPLLVLNTIYSKGKRNWLKALQLYL